MAKDINGIYKNIIVTYADNFFYFKSYIFLDDLHISSVPNENISFQCGSSGVWVLWTTGMGRPVSHTPTYN